MATGWVTPSELTAGHGEDLIRRCLPSAPCQLNAGASSSRETRDSPEGKRER